MVGLWNHLAIKFDRDSSALHVEFVDKRGKVRVALDTAGRAVQLHCDEGRNLGHFRGHLKSRFPGALGSGFGRSRDRCAIARIYHGFPTPALPGSGSRGLSHGRSQRLLTHPQPTTRPISLKSSRSQKNFRARGIPLARLATAFGRLARRRWSRKDHPSPAPAGKTMTERTAEPRMGKSSRRCEGPHMEEIASRTRSALTTLRVNG